MLVKSSYINCSSYILRSSVRRKYLKKFTICGNDRSKLFCHENVLATAFPERNFNDMDQEQLSLLLLTQHFNFTVTMVFQRALLTGY